MESNRQEIRLGQDRCMGLEMGLEMLLVKS